MARISLIVAFLILAAVAAAAFFAWLGSAPRAPDAGAVVIRPVAPREAAPVPTPAPSASPTRSAMEAAILDSMADPRAELRDVVTRRDAPQIACGEKRTSRDPVFRRFVWLGHLKMLATDDGSRDFGNILAVCREGQPVP
ncbi:hypothetical protein [Sphingomonas sp. NIBR02145]|uniref:hypothetical protein n=1 Tax=Sphingomonas sp. NIBR02145 TaxID=3014784 RepID=UPI0022B5AC84|nr:hypothetical protein [Sphingomonas sp. NIBR02145]WHU04467.1 hypothetical protein O3305_07715 [Sphingomonas sp. NIBR02145]